LPLAPTRNPSRATTFAPAAMGACCSNNAKGAVVQPGARPQAQQQQARGQPVLLEQSSAANSTKAEQLKAAEEAKAADAPAAGGQGLSVEEFLQRVSTKNEERDCTQIKTLTYNLFWWNLYGQRGGNSGSASKLIAASTPDLIGCQECDDISRVLYEGELQSTYAVVRGPHSLGMAYKRSEFDLLERGYADVSTDEPEQFYGARGVEWARLQHKPSGKAVFFMNHHGPLRVNSGGREGGPMTAYNIVKEIYNHTQPGDVVILVGDFNAQAGSQTIREIERYLPRTSSGVAFGGVDHFFSHQPMAAQENLGNGGSDHDALTATFLI